MLRETRYQYIAEQSQNFIIPYIKINSKLNKELNIRLDTLKFLKEKLRDVFQYTGISRDTPNQILAVWEIRLKPDKSDVIKLKLFCTAKNWWSEEAAHRIEENLCYTSDRELQSNIKTYKTKYQKTTQSNYGPFILKKIS